ncbi:lambda-crystallin-like [Amphiura filiformis]|uniref:lambda-crystallin-like n=1 Tax=Amphiura filiformis TaxID=82378 RepID=UPI003B20DE6A
MATTEEQQDIENEEKELETGARDAAEEEDNVENDGNSAGYEEEEEALSGSRKIGIVGSGLIGRSWAMIFASAGYTVSLYDIEFKQVEDAIEDIKKQLHDLYRQGLLRGDLSVEEQLLLITGSNDLGETVTGAQHVIECVPEKLPLKEKVFKQIEQFADDHTVLSSSTSCIPASRFTEGLKRRNQCIVTHPVNPPYHVPLVEIVPSPWTDEDIVLRTRKLLQEIGQVPVTLKNELPGFVLNRIQYSIINECYKLVAGGVMTAEDVDKVMTAGLGMRYAFLGPFEVMHLNAEGFGNYIERYGPTIRTVSNTFGPPPTFIGPGTEKVKKQLEDLIPLDQLEERRQLRDAKVAALSKLKRDLNS